MDTPRRQRNVGVHSIPLWMLLFTVSSLNGFKTTEGCIERTYLALLPNDTGTPDNTTSNSIKNAVDNIISSNCNISVRFNGTIFPYRQIAFLDISVRYQSGFTEFEDALLKGIDYEGGNKTLLPWSRVFMATFNVTDPETNNSVLEPSINGIFGRYTIATLISNASSSRIFRVWLEDVRGSRYPYEELRPLQEKIQSGSLNGVSVKPNTFMAYILYPALQTKEYKVEFDFSLQECNSSAIANNSAKHMSLKSQLDALLNASFSSLQGYDDVEVTSIRCAQTSKARALVAQAHVAALLKLQKSSSSSPTSIGEALDSCSSSSSSQSKISNVKVMLLTPTSFSESLKATIVCPTTNPLSITTSVTKPATKKPTPESTTVEPSTAPPTLGKTPRLFVRLRLALTWSQFCSKLEESLKHSIAKNVYDKNDNAVSPDRVVFINSHKHCADPKKAEEKVDLWFYISDKSGSLKPSTCVTLKAHRVLRMMVNNGNTKMLGSDFAAKVISAYLAGCDAKKHDKNNNSVDWTLILIIIAVIVGAVLLFLACCCICCGAARRRRRRRYEDKHGNMELIIVNGAYVNPNEVDAKANGQGEKGAMGNEEENLGNKGNRSHLRGGRGYNGGKGIGAGYNNFSDNDSDEYYDCCGAGGRSKPKGLKAKTKKKTREKDDKKSKKDESDKDGKHDGNGKENNNADKLSGDANTTDGSENDKGNKPDGSSTPRSYRNLAFGLGDRKPSTGNEYETIRDPNTDAVSHGSGGAPLRASGAVSGAAAGLLAGQLNDVTKRGSLTPAIITSPAPDTGAPQYANVNSPNDRRGSASMSGSPVGSRPSSGSGLKNQIDDEQLRERRRSSIHSLVDDNAEPLKHKTATVGIVGLALRNKNERKKETEFKNLDKEMPALGTYPPNTAGKNRFPEILPNPHSRVKLSSSPDYINASYLHDHKGQRHYIATQHPLEETLDDYWQMVWDQESYLIVMVNDDENSKQIEYPTYWPTAEGETKNFNGISVSNKQVVIKADYITTTLNITNTRMKPAATREIIHYRFTSWKTKDTVPNVAMFVGFVVATRETGRKYEDGKYPVIVHCSDGQGFSGVFIALDIGIRSHEESKTSVVDLFELAKRLRRGRSGIINTLQLYNFSYQCLYEYTVNYDEEAEKKKEG